MEVVEKWACSACGEFLSRKGWERTGYLVRQAPCDQCKETCEVLSEYVGQQASPLRDSTIVVETQPKPPACGDCRFFEHYDGNEGFCLRYPPAANPMSVENAICRPVVLLHEWCGEFQPKPLPVPPSETSKVRQTVIEGRNVGETAP